MILCSLVINDQSVADDDNEVQLCVHELQAKCLRLILSPSETNKNASCN